MRRLLFRILTALSLLLFLIFVVLRVRSWFAYDQISYASWNESARKVSRTIVGWDRGQLDYVLFTYEVNPGSALSALKFVPGPGWGYRVYHPPHEGTPERSWFYEHSGLGMGTIPATGRRWQIEMPIWPFIALTAILPSLWLWKAVKRRRMAGPGLCPGCGYDLRASAERCPECGRLILPSPAALAQSNA